MLRWLVRIGRALQESGGTRISLREAADAAGRRESLSVTEAEDRVHRLVNATGVVRTVVDEQGAALRPWHRTFQEYLAALSLLDTGESVDAIVKKLDHTRPGAPSRLHDPFWTGVLRFSVGVFGARGQSERARALVKAWLVEAELEEKFNTAASRRREGHLLALAVAGVREYRQELFKGSELLETLPELVARRYEAGGVDWAWRERVDALDALGALGDPRLPDPRESLVGWVFVEAGEVEIGDNSEAAKDENYDPLPKQRFRHSALWVRRHPVTVAEYAWFLKESGPEHIPRNWGGQSLHETRPVVNVVWQDARAFCAWAQKAWKLPGAGVLDLPTSREWEAVALGDRGGPYPWGDQESGTGDQSRAAYDWELTGARPLKAAVPVGAFPAGHTGGLWDLAGNAWEWCASVYDMWAWAESDCPHFSADEETIVSTAPDNFRTVAILRGGSWVDANNDLRCAHWISSILLHRSALFGFRVVVRVPPA